MGNKQGEQRKPCLEEPWQADVEGWSRAWWLGPFWGFRSQKKMLKLELGQGSSETPDQTHEKSLPGKRQQVLPS